MEFEFDLSAPVADLSAVPAEYHGFYSQGDDGYTVADTHKKIASNINGLRKNLVTSRTKLSTANGESAERRIALKGFTDIADGIEGLEDKSPAGVDAYIADLVAKAAKGGKDGEDATAQLEAAKIAMTTKHTGEIDVLNQANAGLITEIRELLINDRCTASIVEAEGNPSLLSPMLKAECQIKEDENGKRIVVIIGEDGEPRYNGEGDLLTIEQRVAELKEDAKFQGAFNGQVRGGADTKGGKVATKVGAVKAEDRTASQNIAAGLAKRRKAIGR